MLDVINAFAKDPSTWTVDEPSTNAVASTSAAATRAAPARRTASAPTTRPRQAYSDIISELDDIKDFTEEIQSDDVDMDVWEERQRLKQNGKGKERELINGANKPPTASQKAKSPAKRKGKTDEEKVSRHGRPLRGLRPRASLSVDQIADPHDGFDLFVGG